MTIASRRNLAAAIVRLLLTLLRGRSRPQPPSPAICDDADLAQRVRLTGEW